MRGSAETKDRAAQEAADMSERRELQGEAKELLRVKDLRVGFRPHYESILNRLHFRMREGETIGFLGESGCGKTLTALSIIGLLPSTAKGDGEIYLRGEALHKLDEAGWRKKRGAALAMIFQDPLQALNPLSRIGTQVGESLAIHRPSLPARERKEQVLEMLRRLEFETPEAVYQSFPHELSGGMRQRACLALALINHPSLLLADEPTTALDLSVQERILNALRRIREEDRLAILFISHDIRVHRRFCDRVFVFYAGEIVESGAVSEVLEHPAHVYTRLLLDAMPARAANGSFLPDIPGRVPSSAEIVAHHRNPEAGCIFAGRCPRKLPCCDVSPPPSVRVGARHQAACHLLSGLSDFHGTDELHGGANG